MYPTWKSYIQQQSPCHGNTGSHMQPYLIVLPKTSLRQDNYMIPSHMTCKKPNLKNESDDWNSSKNGPFTSPLNSDQSPIHSGPHQGHCMHCLCLGITKPWPSEFEDNSKTLWVSPIEMMKRAAPIQSMGSTKASLNFIFINDDDEAWQRPDSRLQPYNNL